MSDPDYPQYDPGRYIDACPECGHDQPYMTPVSDTDSDTEFNGFFAYDTVTEKWALLAEIECVSDDCEYSDVINLRPRR